MAISFECPKCGKGYNVGEDLAGKKAKCKCGHQIVVPQPAPPSEGDAMSDLLDAELPPVGEELPPGHAAARPGPAPLQPVASPRRKSKSGPGPMLWVGIGVGGLVGLGVLLAVVFLLMGPKKPAEVAEKPAEPVEEEAAPTGYATPQEVYDASLKAHGDKDWKTLISLYTPESHETIVGGLAMGALMLGADNPKMGELMGKHGIDESLWKVSMPGISDLGKSAQDPGKAMQAAMKGMQEMQGKSKKLAAAVDDKPTFFVDLMTLMDSLRGGLAKKGALSGVDFAKIQEESMEAQKNAKLVDVEIEGDTARGSQAISISGKELKVPIEFRKVDESWLLHQPEVDLSQGMPSGNLGGGNPLGQ